MHTHSHTHTLLQQGLLYYNRRIPKALGGGLIRIKLPDSSIAETLSKRIEAAWAMGYSPDPALILANIIEETKPLSLDKIAEDYIRIRQISPKPVLISIKMLMDVAGQKPLVDYNRADVRSFLIKSKEVGHRTTTIRRRLNSLSAVFNFAYHEYEIDRGQRRSSAWPKTCRELTLELQSDLRSASVSLRQPLSASVSLCLALSASVNLCQH